MSKPIDKKKINQLGAILDRLAYLLDQKTTSLANKTNLKEASGGPLLSTTSKSALNSSSDQRKLLKK